MSENDIDIPSDKQIDDGEVDSVAGSGGDAFIYVS